MQVMVDGRESLHILHVFDQTYKGRQRDNLKFLCKKPDFLVCNISFVSPKHLCKLLAFKILLRIDESFIFTAVPVKPSLSF